MRRWLAELVGEAFDVDEFPYWFPRGEASEPYAWQDGDKTFLVPVVDITEEASVAEEAALTALDEMYEVIRLVQAVVRRPSIGTMYREESDGTRKAFVLLKASLSGRAKLRATLGEQSIPAAPTQAQQYLAAARQDRHLKVALSILALPHASWSHLY